MAKLYFAFFFIVLIGAGCDLDSDPIIIPNVEDEFFIELREEFGNGDRDLFWNLSTIESVWCEGAAINFSFLRESSRALSLSINDVSAASDCEPADQPAQSDVEIGPLDQGTYTLQISLRDALSQEGVLRVFDEFFQIDLEEVNGVVALRERLYRIPDQSVWGFVDHKGEEELINAASLFLEDLEEITQGRLLSNGHYGYFESGSNGAEITFTDAVTTSQTLLTFQRGFNENKAAIVDLIEHYRMSYPALNIQVFNTLGEDW